MLIMGWTQASEQGTCRHTTIRMTAEPAYKVKPKRLQCLNHYATQLKEKAMPVGSHIGSLGLYM